VEPPGSLGGNAQRGPRTATRQAMVAQCSPSPIGRGPNSASPKSMGRKPPHPDAEGIADDSGDEYGEHQRPDAKTVMEFHWISTAGQPQQAAPHRKSKVESESLAPYFLSLT
jgi:hypothetical protein